MVTYSEYVKDVFEKILQSYNVIYNLKDKPGDLDTIKVELAKINGFLNVIIKKGDNVQSFKDDIEEIVIRAQKYHDDYYFEREIEVMEPIYSDDPDRLRHIRIKILESLNDRKLIERIKSITDQL